jgi:hypothetical protein
MGLEASVMCNCHKKGKTKRPPFIDPLIIDEAGFPDIDAVGEEYDAQYTALQDWLADCCEHPYMNYAEVFIANWKGYRAFLDALESLGWEHFPTLQAELPGSNDSLTAPDAALRAIKELEYFREYGNGAAKAFLVDSERSVDVGTSSSILGGALTLDSQTGFDVGFDADGFFVRDRWEMNRELFRAMRVEQRLLHPELLKVEYIDRDTGRTFVCGTPFGKIVTGEDGLQRMFLQQMHVEYRTVGADYFAYILNPLTQIFEAAIQMRNPVRWS